MNHAGPLESFAGLIAIVLMIAALHALSRGWPDPDRHPRLFVVLEFFALVEDPDLDRCEVDR